MNLAYEKAPAYGVASTCSALGVSRATYYRRFKTTAAQKTPRPRPPPARKLSEEEEAYILEVLCEDRFADRSVPEVYAALLDEAVHLASIRTFYRLLHKSRAAQERRNIRQHQNSQTPRLLATAPNQVWSWDITKLKGPDKWECFYLYVILDIYSRYAVGWMLADRESQTLAEQFIQEASRRQGIQPGQLTLHADRGPSMRSQCVAQLLAGLGVQKSHSRPRVSNDNPYSESQFKTLKYTPGFPKRFGSMQDARAFLTKFFDWYNHEHHHTGIALMTPAAVHHGRVQDVLAIRAAALAKAYEAHPERFVQGAPQPQRPPEQVWINKPAEPEEMSA